MEWFAIQLRAMIDKGMSPTVEEICDALMETAQTQRDASFEKCLERIEGKVRRRSTKAA